MRKIVNLTGFKTSDNQKDLGVIDLSEENREEVLKLQSFREIPKKRDVRKRAEQILEIALLSYEEGGYFLIGGPSFLLPPLVEVLKEVFYIPLFCVTKRYTMETIWSDWTPCRDDINYHYDFIEA